MDIFCTDLDQTLIYSYKHEIGKAKRCVDLSGAGGFVSDRKDVLVIIRVTKTDRYRSGDDKNYGAISAD